MHNVAQRLVEKHEGWSGEYLEQEPHDPNVLQVFNDDKVEHVVFALVPTEKRMVVNVMIGEVYIDAEWQMTDDVEAQFAELIEAVVAQNSISILKAMAKYEKGN